MFTYSCISSDLTNPRCFLCGHPQGTRPPAQVSRSASESGCRLAANNSDVAPDIPDCRCNSLGCRPYCRSSASLPANSGSGRSCRSCRSCCRRGSVPGSIAGCQRKRQREAEPARNRTGFFSLSLVSVVKHETLILGVVPRRNKRIVVAPHTVASLRH